MVTNNMRFKANFGKIADFRDVILSQLWKYQIYDDNIGWKCHGIF